MNVEGSDGRPMDEGGETSVLENKFSNTLCSEFDAHNCLSYINSQCRKRPLDPESQLSVE